MKMPKHVDSDSEDSGGIYPEQLLHSESSDMNIPEVIIDDRVNGKETSSIVKIMKKKSKVFVVDSYNIRAGITKLDKSVVGLELDDSIDSYPFVVGGYSFTMHLYPHRAGKLCESVSLCIKNQSSKTAHVAFELLLLDRKFGPHREHYCRGSSYYDRTRYHQVVVVEPGCRFGTLSVAPRIYISDDATMFKATIGVVDFDHHHQPPQNSLSFDFERCILFQVGDRTYYAQESIITRRCPALLSEYPQSNHFVVISDVETDVFQAVLWFLNNKKLHQQDREAIANPKKRFVCSLDGCSS